MEYCLCISCPQHSTHIVFTSTCSLKSICFSFDHIIVVQGRQTVWITLEPGERSIVFKRNEVNKVKFEDESVRISTTVRATAKPFTPLCSPSGRDTISTLWWTQTYPPFCSSTYGYWDMHHFICQFCHTDLYAEGDKIWYKVNLYEWVRNNIFHNLYLVVN